MNFSIIVPSKGRVEQLTELLSTIIRCTNDLSQTEVIVTIDTDEKQMESYTELMNNYPGPKQFIIQEHCDNLNDGYYNMMALKAHGKYIIAVNDDCVFGTVGWDEIILNAVKERKLEGKICFLKTGGNGVAYHEGSYPPFPGLSKEAVQAMGFFHWPGIWTWDADEVLWNAFHGLKNNYGHDRIVIVIDVAIQHLNAENHKYSEPNLSYEETTNNMIRNYNKGDCGKDFHHYPQMISLLNNGIKKENA